MNKLKISLFFLIILLINPIDSLCQESQININTASLEKLDQLSGIGPVKGQAIIDTRPFNSIEELINVYGIGEVTLENIKTQGLACVNNENKQEDNQNETSEDINEDEEAEENKEVNISEEVRKEVLSDTKENKNENITLNNIELNPKDIKNPDDNKFSINKLINIKFGLISFCILLAVLFIIQILIKKNKTKNELV